MRIQEENKSVEFSIIDYQFPNEKLSEKDDYNYDANWLTVKIIYAADIGVMEYTDSCILTNELAETVSDMEKVLNGQQSCFISDYMEPYLKFAVAKTENNYVIQLYFVCDVTDGHWNTISITETVDISKLEEMKNELESYLISFPER